MYLAFTEKCLGGSLNPVLGELCMNKLKEQASHLWLLLIAPETWMTYQKTILTTWMILKESALLLWLFICLGLVFFEWFWKTAVTAGQRCRQWFKNLNGTSDQIATEASRALLNAGKGGLNATLNLARTQLGLPKQVPVVTPAPAQTVPPKVSSPPVEPAAAATPPASERSTPE
jgi:hypothetical protein